jgi:hypothetical protein
MILPELNDTLWNGDDLESLGIFWVLLDKRSNASRDLRIRLYDNTGELKYH